MSIDSFKTKYDMIVTVTKLPRGKSVVVKTMWNSNPDVNTRLVLTKDETRRLIRALLESI